MRMRTKLPIVFLVGAGALLLAALAVVVAPRAQTVYAQNPGPSVEIGPEPLQRARDTWPGPGAVHLQEYSKLKVRCECRRSAQCNVQ